LILSREADEAHGSGRSIAAFHLLEAIESCPELFSRYGGHAHAVGFALPSANIEKLRQHLDAYARARLTPADFEPQLEFDRELPLREITPELYRSLQLLEPFGMGNEEPTFIANGVRLMTPPQAVKDKHVRLRVAHAMSGDAVGGQDFTPRCHPDSAAISKREGGSAAAGSAAVAQIATEQPSWRDNISFKAMGWRLRETCDNQKLLAGDRLDIAFTLGMNDHPEFGGLELSLRDVVRAG
jgi:single-stranded-DNA-specific exonuclease